MPYERVQRLRFQRVLLAIGASAVTVAITGLVAWAGYLSTGVAVTYTVLVAAVCVATYVLMRTNLNTRLPDPSLTGPLLVAAGLLISYVAYEGEGARPAFIAMYLIAYMFGIFTLNLRGLVWTAVFYLACYVGVVALSIVFRPATTDFAREGFRIVALTILLAWMTAFGSYISRLRQNLRHTNERLRHALTRTEVLANEDPVTGFANRRRIMDLLSVEVKRARRGSPLSVCLLDIDHFKGINDGHGHQAGDLVMKEFAEVTQAMLRATDFFGRYGGDEFLIGLSQTTLADAKQVAERVRRTVERRMFPSLPAGQRVTLSIGVAEYRPHESLEQLVARADAALYEAKRQGRNRVV